MALALSCAGAACAPAPGTPDDGPAITYEGVQTLLLRDDLVAVQARLRGADGPDAVEDYARCAAAGYTLIRGYGFARHVRTRIARTDGLWLADAVYTVSAALPQGVARIDAEVQAEACAERGIPLI